MSEIMEKAFALVSADPLPEDAIEQFDALYEEADELDRIDLARMAEALELRVNEETEPR